MICLIGELCSAELIKGCPDGEHVKDRRLLEFQVETNTAWNNLGVVWGRSEVGRCFIVQPEKLKNWGFLAFPVLTELSGA